MVAILAEGLGLACGDVGGRRLAPSLTTCASAKTITSDEERPRVAGRGQASGVDLLSRPSSLRTKANNSKCVAGRVPAVDRPVSARVFNWPVKVNRDRVGPWSQVRTPLARRIARRTWRPLRSPNSFSRVSLISQARPARRRPCPAPHCCGHDRTVIRSSGRPPASWAVFCSISPHV